MNEKNLKLISNVEYSIHDYFQNRIVSLLSATLHLTNILTLKFLLLYIF